MIRNIVVDKMGYKLFFVESVCDDPSIVEQNIMVGENDSAWISLYEKNFLIISAIKPFSSPLGENYA